MAHQLLRAATTVACSSIILSGCGHYAWISKADFTFSTKGEMTVPHIDDTAIRVKSSGGDITVVEDANADGVLITYELRATSQEILDQTELRAERIEGDTLSIYAHGPDHDKWRKRHYASVVDVRVRDATSVDLHTGSGTIIVRGLGEPGHTSVADTGSGGVRVEAHNADLKADTGSGGVTVTNQRGRLEADTGSGTVRITGGEGPVVADTGSGDVIVKARAGMSSVVADTGSGNVTLEAVSGHFHVDTGSGDVLIWLTPDWKGWWSTDTGSGSVRTEGPPSYDRTKERSEVDTGSGNVTIRVAKPNGEPL